MTSLGAPLAFSSQDYLSQKQADEHCHLGMSIKQELVLTLNFAKYLVV